MRVFAVVILLLHGDGSDGRHVCTKYHGHTQYFQATMLVIARGYLLLSFIVTMAMVVMADMCVQSITAICTYFYQQLIGCWVAKIIVRQRVHEIYAI